MINFDLKNIMNIVQSLVPYIDYDYDYDEKKFYYFTYKANRIFEDSVLTSSRLETWNKSNDTIIIKMEDGSQLWITLSDTAEFRKYPDYKNKKDRSFFFGVLENSITFSDLKGFKESQDIPETLDEYFNLSLCNDLYYTFEEFQEINSVLLSNKELLRKYSISIELSWTQ